MSEDTTVEATPALLQGYGEIFAQLLESERFKAFFALHFTLNKVVDEFEKTITFHLLENPPEIIARKMAEAVAQAQGKVEVIPEMVAKSVLKNAKERAKKH